MGLDIFGLDSEAPAGPDSSDAFGATISLVGRMIEASLLHDEAAVGVAISTIHARLSALVSAKPSAEPSAVAAPAVPIENSVQDDFIVSLIDGKPYKALKRHLTSHGLTPAAYRERFGLPGDYPMTAPSYSAKRSALAKAGGLGRKPGLAAAA